MDIGHSRTSSRRPGAVGAATFIVSLGAGAILSGCAGNAGVETGATGGRPEGGSGGVVSGVNTGGVGGAGLGSGTGGAVGTAAGTGGNTGSGGSGRGGAPGTGGASAVTCTINITAPILANQSVSLSGDSCVDLPATTTQYDGVISGLGTLRLRAPNGPGTLIVTADSTFALPPSQQVETATETKSPTDPNHVHYFVIDNPNPPAVFIDAGATLQLGTPQSTTGSIGNYIPNTNGTVINLDNFRIDGTLVLQSGPTLHMGILSGGGVIRRPAVGPAGGTVFFVGDNPFNGVYSQLFGGYFGSDHVIFSLPNATIFSNESFIVAAPEGQFGASAGHVLKFPQTIWENHYGDDINTNSGRVVFSGVYSYSDSGDQLKPRLSNPALNTMVVQNVAGSRTGGSNSSFRGINIEGGTTEWGDGTTSAFFLPSAPSPAAPDSTVKNAYINLHKGATLVFNYNGRFVCNVGVTGGGGGPRADGSIGVGNLTIAPTPGNFAVLTMPQNYNGTTTIGAGATLQLGNGAPVQAMKATVGAPTVAEPGGAVTDVAVVASYSGDSGLLTSESPGGAPTDNIVNNGHLIVNNTTAALTLSHITGSGTFTQAGPASVTILANNYSGGTVIEGGAMFVADASALGTGDVINGAVLAAASGEGVIKVAGAYHQRARGTLHLQLPGRGRGVSLQVAGRADLAGALVLSGGAESTAAPGRPFVLIRAAGGIHGKFRSIVTDGRNLSVAYHRTTCVVTVKGRRSSAPDPARAPGPAWGKAPLASDP